MKKTLSVCIVGVFVMCFFNGCSAENLGGFDLNKEDCTRRSILSLTEGEFSGKGYADDVLTALYYVYTNEKLEKEYGNAFDVDEAVRTKGTTTAIIPRTPLYNGKTICYVSINSDRWTVIVEKGYQGKWEVVDCHLYSTDDGEWLSPDTESDTSQEG